MGNMRGRVEKAFLVAVALDGSEVTTAESGTPPKVFEPRTRNRTFSSFPASAAGTPMTRSRISPRAMSAISWIPSTGAYPARRILHGQVDRLRDGRPARRKGKADAPARAARPSRSQADAQRKIRMAAARNAAGEAAQEPAAS